MSPNPNEEEVVCLLIRHLRVTGDGTWIVKERPDPPDFLLKRYISGERMGVEVTTFNWPSNTGTWTRALRSLCEGAGTLARGRVEGQYWLWVDVPNQKAFSKHFRALTRSQRSASAKMLANHIVVFGNDACREDRLLINDPLEGAITRQRETGDAVISWRSRLDIGENLTAISRDLDSLIRRKARSLGYRETERKMLIIDYYASSLDTLRLLADQLVVPDRVDEIYFVLHEEEGKSTIIPLSNLDEASVPSLEESGE